MRSGHPLYGREPHRFTLHLISAVAILLPLLLALPARAGSMHEEFVQELNSTPAGGTLSGLIMLSSQLDLAQLERELAAPQFQTRWRRHEHVIEAAQALAAQTQGPLLAELARRRAAGEVVSYQPFWITNMIAVEARPAVFEALSLRGDVGMIFRNEPISLRLGTPDPDAPPIGYHHTASGRDLQDGLIAIDVEPAWNAGYTGAGRLVCGFDTGVDGTHPAFADRWRGTVPGVPWYHAWNDPYFNTNFPWDSAVHGTHTMGIMVANPPGGDPLGVAWQAQWIAAGILIQWNVQKVINCYQWAADPDSIPSTIDDVPDVVNNSWGTGGACDATFWNAIDVVEAAGVVNTIAVDNSGPGPASVHSPESRVTTLYKNFGVGDIDPHTGGYPINPTSGRGPSPCDMISIKPEVVGPGVNIYSTLPGGNYGNLSGTSMACPHVSGAAAILRQVNPSLTVDQIKQALMSTARDLGDPGPDNTYGWGLIDVWAAVQYVLANEPPAPSPLDLTATVEHLDSVALGWQVPPGINPANPLNGYNVYRAMNQDPYPPSPIIHLDASTLAYTDPDLPQGSYRYVVTATYQKGESEPSNEVHVLIDYTAAVPGAGPGGRRPVLVVQPDPLDPAAGGEIRLTVPDGTRLRVELFDAAGRRVLTLAREASPRSGLIRLRFDGRDDRGRALPAGAYFAVATTSGGTLSHRLVIVR